MVRAADVVVVGGGNISSVVAHLGVPMLGWYGVSKHGLAGVTAALRAEVAPFGIKVILIEPGGFNDRALAITTGLRSTPVPWLWPTGCSRQRRKTSSAAWSSGSGGDPGRYGVPSTG